MSYVSFYVSEDFPTPTDGTPVTWSVYSEQYRSADNNGYPIDNSQALVESGFLTEQDAERRANELFRATQKIAGREFADYLAVFIHGYCVAMLFANTRIEGDDDGDVDPAWWQTDQDPNWGISAFDDKSRASITEDCTAFVNSCAADLTLADRREQFRDREYGPEQAGHDFALTRNHHGAGFWDRGLSDVGDRLTAAAHPYGESNAWCTGTDDESDQLAHLDG